jgi:hypothetical protein
VARPARRRLVPPRRGQAGGGARPRTSIPRALRWFSLKRV